MIELRPSDVMKAQAENQNKVFDILGMVMGKLGEAEKVNQVNNGLTEAMRSEAAWQNLEAQQMYDRQPEYGGGSGQDVGEVKKIDFGHATEFEVKATHDKFIKAQNEVILGAATHPGAKRELQFHLEQQGIVSWQKTRQNWRETRQKVAVADLKTLSAELMKSDLPWDKKVIGFKSRVDAAVRALDIYPDVGEGYVQEFTEAAQDTDAFAGSLNAMRAAGSAEAGIDWLDKNTPYLTPERREKATEIVLSKFAVIAKQNDEALDVKYSNLHINADTVGKVDQALAQLKVDRYYNGDQKYYQQMRFEALRTRIENEGKLPKTSIDDIYKANEDKYRAILTFAMNDGKSPEALQKQVRDAYDKGDVRGSFVMEMDTHFAAKTDPVFSGALDLIKNKASGLSEADQFRVTNRFLDEYKKNPQWTGTQIEQAVTNIIKPVVARNLKKISANMAGEDRVIDELEKLNDDITKGLYTGITGQRKELLDTYGAILKEKAHQMFPTEFPEGTGSFTIDYNGQYGGGEGMPILIDKKRDAYAFQLEGTNLKLYKLEKNREGKWERYPVVKAGTAKAEATLKGKEVEAERVRKTESDEFKILTQYVDRGEPYQKDSHGWFQAGQEAGKRIYVPAARAAELESMARQ
jgi:hypothetical protein